MSSIGVGIFPHHGRVTTRAILLARQSNAGLAAALSLYFFGQPVIALAATGSAEGFCLATLRLSSWLRNSGGYTLTTATPNRAAVVFPGPVESNHAVKITAVGPGAGAMVMLRSSADGRSGYEVGILDGAAINSGLTTPNWYAVIRRVSESKPIDEDSSGSATYAVPAGASDTPASGYVYADVNSRVTSGAALVLEARISAGVVELRIDGEATPTLRHDADGASYAPQADTSTFGTSKVGSFSANTCAGFASSVNGARVLDAAVYSLKGETTSATDVLMASAAGDVWACQDGTNILRCAAGVFAGNADLEAVPFEAVMLIVGEGLARTFDPVTTLVAKWTPTAGTLPGQTSDGTTTARGVATHGTRAALYNIEGDESNIWFTAVGDYNDLDTGSELRGAAFTLAGFRPLKLGHPVVAMQQASNSASIVAGHDSIQSVLGDPILGNFDTSILDDRAGISGPRSMLQLQENMVIGHGRTGLFMIPPTGTARNVSRDVLNEIINLTKEQQDSTTPLVARDPDRQLVHLFLTPNDGTAGRHLIFSERQQHLYESSFPADMQPTCAEYWNGQLILGCLDGYVRVFDPAALTDDGEAIDARMVLGPWIGGIGRDASVCDIRLMLADDSGPVTLKVLGAVTAESIFNDAKVKTLLSTSIGAFRHEPIPHQVRHRAVAIELGHSAKDSTAMFEGISAMVQPTKQPTAT